MHFRPWQYFPIQDELLARMAIIMIVSLEEEADCMYQDSKSKQSCTSCFNHRLRAVEDFKVM